MLKLQRTCLATLLLLLSGWLLVSCSKSDPVDAASDTAAAAQKPPIKIGAIFAVTGPAGFLGAPEKRTAEMLVEQINAQGGVNGHPIELIVMDSVGDATKAVSAAKQLIEEEQVFAIIGPTRSGPSMKVKDICEQTQTLMLSCAAAEEIVNPVARYVFKTPQKDSFAAQMIFDRMRTMGIKRVAALYGGTGFGKGGAEQLTKYAPDYGIELVMLEMYDPAAINLSDLVTKVKGANVDAVVNWSIVSAQGIIASNMRQKQLEIPLFQSHGYGNIKYVEQAPEASEGTLFPCGRLLIAEALPEDHPQKQVLMAYKKAYEEKFGEAASTFGGHAYDALMLLVNAITVADSLDKEKVRDALESTKGFVGTAGIFNMSAEDHNGLQIDAFEMLTVKDGKFAPAP